MDYESPPLNEIMKTEEYKLSIELMSIRNKLKFSPKEFSKKLNISLDELLKLEYGARNIPIERYKQIIKLAHNIKK